MDSYLRPSPTPSQREVTPPSPSPGPRSRTGVACLRCRKDKTKCVSRDPAPCERCVSKNEEAACRYLTIDQQLQEQRALSIPEPSPALTERSSSTMSSEMPPTPYSAHPLEFAPPQPEVPFQGRQTDFQWAGQQNYLQRPENWHQLQYGPVDLENTPGASIPRAMQGYSPSYISTSQAPYDQATAPWNRHGAFISPSSPQEQYTGVNSQELIVHQYKATEYQQGNDLGQGGNVPWWHYPQE